MPGGYAVVATSDHANDGLTESAFPLHGSDDLVNWQPQVRIEYMFALLRRITMIARNMCQNKILTLNNVVVTIFSPSGICFPPWWLACLGGSQYVGPGDSLCVRCNGDEIDSI